MALEQARSACDQAAAAYREAEAACDDAPACRAAAERSRRAACRAWDLALENPQLQRLADDADHWAAQAERTADHAEDHAEGYRRAAGGQGPAGAPAGGRPVTTTFNPRLAAALCSAARVGDRVAALAVADARLRFPNLFKENVPPMSTIPATLADITAELALAVEEATRGDDASYALHWELATRRLVQLAGQLKEVQKVLNFDRTVTVRELLRLARHLRSKDGEHYEYDRALLELVGHAAGLCMADDKNRSLVASAIVGRP